MRTGSDLTDVVLTSSCALVDTKNSPACLCGNAARNHSRVLDNPSVFQLNDAIAVGRVRLRVRHLNDRGSLLVQSAKQLHDFLRLAGMQIAGGLVCQNQLWIASDSARHAY